MSTIDLDALEALIQALNDADRGWSAQDVVTTIKHLDEAGWQIARKPDDPELHSEIEPDAMPASRPSHAWPPFGVTQKLWAEINPGGLVLIEDAIGLRAAQGINSTIYEAGTIEDAKKYVCDPNLVRRDWFEYDGTKFDFMTDQIPF